jgi:hypothetical protein
MDERIARELAALTRRRAVVLGLIAALEAYRADSRPAVERRRRPACGPRTAAPMSGRHESRDADEHG